MAGFRGSGSWIREACTLLIRYIRENFKIATFSRLSGSIKIKGIIREKEMNSQQDCSIEIIQTHCAMCMMIQRSLHFA